MKKCISCGLTDGFISFKKNQYDLFLCPECGLIFLHPQLPQKELISGFYSQESGYHDSLPKHLDEIKNYKSKFIFILERLTELKIEGNILDVGCSNGEFMFLAQKKGFKTYGVEVNKNTANTAINHGLNVFNGTLEEAKFQDGFFSVVFLGDVLEHVINPIELLKECNRILRKGGVLIVATPNTNCFFVQSTYLFHKWFGFPWPVLIPPYHTFVFSDSNLEKILLVENFKKVKAEYLRPNLHHELASTGLAEYIRGKKSVGKFLYALLVFSNYCLLYLINILLRIFTKKDFGMIFFAKKV